MLKNRKVGDEKFFHFLFSECLPETVFWPDIFCFRGVQQRHSTIESECHPHRWTRTKSRPWRGGEAQKSICGMFTLAFSLFLNEIFLMFATFHNFHFSHSRFCSWQQLAFLHHVSPRRSGCSDIWTAATTDICHYKSCTTWNTIKWGFTTQAK